MGIPNASAGISQEGRAWNSRACSLENSWKNGGGGCNEGACRLRRVLKAYWGVVSNLVDYGSFLFFKIIIYHDSFYVENWNPSI